MYPIAHLIYGVPLTDALAAGIAAMEADPDSQWYEDGTAVCGFTQVYSGAASRIVGYCGVALTEFPCVEAPVDLAGLPAPSAEQKRLAEQAVAGLPGAHSDALSAARPPPGLRHQLGPACGQKRPCGGPGGHTGAVDASPPLVMAVARLLHDTWRAAHDGEPRSAPTAAQAPIDTDAAFPDLTADWQAENLAAARFALTAVREATAAGRDPHDPAVFEALAAAVHEDWLARNGDRAPAAQAVPYADLTEAEREKDRRVVRAALTIPGR